MSEIKKRIKDAIIWRKKVVAIRGLNASPAEKNLLWLAETAGELHDALEKIADPRKSDHKESDPQTQLYCVMNIANEAIKDPE